MIQHVAADAIRGERIRPAMGDHEVEGGDSGKKVADIRLDACQSPRIATTAAVPLPAAVHLVVEQRIGDIAGKAEIVTGIVGKGCTIGTGIAVEDRIVVAAFPVFGIGVGRE